MHLHSLPLHGNFSLVGMFLGVIVAPAGLLALLFALAQVIR